MALLGNRDQGCMLNGDLKQTGVMDISRWREAIYAEDLADSLNFASTEVQRS